MLRLIESLLMASPPTTSELVRAVAAVEMVDKLPSLTHVDTGACFGLSLEEAALAATRITMLHFVVTNRCSCSIFILPAGVSLPLHDHPGMTVHHRLLMGRLHDFSLDWVDQGKGLATVVRNAWREPSTDVTIIEPTKGGVLHAFSAGPEGPAVFIDVISPPYFAAPDHAPCTYFDVRPSGLSQAVGVIADPSTRYPAATLPYAVGTQLLAVATGDNDRACPAMDFLTS